MTALVGYFGYGSLVNRETLSTAFVAAYPARLAGWRRHWQSRGIERSGEDEIALLSVHRHVESAIDGMLIIDRAEHMEDVDLREARYDREPIRREHLTLTGSVPDEFPEELFVYVGKPSAPPQMPPKLLQSYLDVVLAGYLREYGETGLAGFLQSTIGFERAIIRDRDVPVYSRARPLSRELAERFDSLLADAGVR